MRDGQPLTSKYREYRNKTQKALKTINFASNVTNSGPAIVELRHRF